MIRCVAPRCTWKSQSIHRLHNHLNKHHGNLDVYECNIGDCSRKYNVKHSFYRHLNKHFERTDNTVSDGTVELPCNEDSFTRTETTTDKTIHQAPVNDGRQAMITEDGHDDKYNGREDGRSSDETTHTSIFTHNLHMIINQMENASLNFNLKYLSANTLPRKVVFDIHQDIQNMFLNPLRNIIGLLESSGCITADGKTVFDELFNNMRCNETEYKFIQYLKKNDLYAEPKEFVLSNELRPGIVRNEQQMSNDPITGEILICIATC